MKKILFVQSSLSSGGSERVMTLLANEFVNRNYDVSMLILYGQNEETYQLNKNIKKIILQYKSKNNFIKKFEQVKKIKNIIKLGKYDYIISFMQSINILTLLASVNVSSKVVISERCNPKERKKFLPNLLSAVLYKKADKIVFQTNDVRNMFKGKIKQISVVIPNPVNEDMPEPYYDDRKKVIVAVGRLTNQKNFQLLIKTFEKFVKKQREYKLEIYGQGPLENELKKLTQTLKIEDKVSFKGFVQNVDECINNAEMYISTSNYEGISNSMIESLALGIPTICTNCPVGGAKLMIKNEQNGILIPVGDSEALLNAMNKISNNKEFAKKIGQNAIKVREDYSIKKITDKWENILLSNNN